MIKKFIQWCREPGQNGLTLIVGLAGIAVSVLLWGLNRRTTRKKEHAEQDGAIGPGSRRAGDVGATHSASEPLGARLRSLGGFALRSTRRFALPSIVIASVVLPTLWGGYLYVQLLRSPISLPQPHDYDAALSQVLELQQLALSEAEAGHPAYFVTHVGCATPRVWQDERLLQNFKHMVDAGVDVKLLAGLTTNKGNPLPSPDWPRQFDAKLKKLGIAGILYMRERELWNHSAVAGSVRRAQAYITSHEKMEIYPTTYITVRDNEACEEWRKYLVEEHEKKRRE